MTINMNRLPVGSIGQMEEFLKSNGFLEMRIEKNEERYEFVKTVLAKTRYPKLKKKEKKIVLEYLKFLSGYSRSHLKNMARKWKKGRLHFNKLRKRHKFPVKYFAPDIARLIKTDVIHSCLNGKTTKEILQREFEKFGKTEYENISRISVSHLYNLRNHNRQYQSSAAMVFKHTQATPANIGIRRKPRPCGKPGYLRVDTVHQGDLDKVKGVYHINIIDEVTQYEMIATVAGISERFLKPVLQELLSLFPFKIHEFHSDNGSEYINQVVAALLTNLLIEQSKSRARKTNDNALVESKNGSIVRKLYGRNFIDQKFAPLINEFNRKYVNIYLNYHRPCQFSEDFIDSKGKIRKKYNSVMIPYEKLKSLKNAEEYLREGFSFEELDKIAYEESDNDFGENMKKAKEELFKKIRNNLTR